MYWYICALLYWTLLITGFGCVLGVIFTFCEGFKCKGNIGIAIIGFVGMILAFSGAWNFSNDVFAGPAVDINAALKDGDSVNVKWIDEDQKSAVVQKLDGNKNDIFISSKVLLDEKLAIKEPGTYLVNKKGYFTYEFIKIDVKQPPEAITAPTQ